MAISRELFVKTWKSTVSRALYRRGDSLLNTLVINAVNRGVLTMLCSAINMILVSTPLPEKIFYVASGFDFCIEVPSEAKYLLLLPWAPAQRKM